MIDLHCHSTASDGTYSPEELVKLAESRGVTHFALTDHDTTDGLEEFMSVPSLVKRIPGIELSVDFKDGELHLVGLLIDKDAPAMKALVKEVKEYRLERNKLMLEKLSALVKKQVKAEDLLEHANGQLGRPHMAKYLLRNGFVGSLQEAFDKYLADGSPFSVPKRRISIDRAIDTVKDSGGLTILAHPSKLKLSDEELENLVKDYTEKGLDGIEAYSSHSPEDKRNYYADLGEKYGLIISGGSDFHGANAKVSTVGADLGPLKDEDILEPLYKRAGI